MTQYEDTPFVSLRLGPAWILPSRKKGWVSRRVPANPNRKMHWVVRHKWTVAWKTVVQGVFLENKKKFGKLPLENPKLEIVLSGIQTMDRDNAYAACKAIIDTFKIPKKINDIGLGVIVDDSEEDIELVVRQTKVAHIADEGVTINFYRKTNV